MNLLDDTSHRMVLRYHPRIGHLFVPNLRARIPGEEGGYFVNTNSSGFRSEIEYEEKKSGTPRILLLGDSFTAGDGCGQEQCFSSLLESSLGAEVYNYAIPGTGTDQQLLIFEEFAKNVEADLVVLCVYVENIERIQVSGRESLVRVTGDRVIVPKPYFRLEDDGLVLHNVPVPMERNPVEAQKAGKLDSANSQRLIYKMRSSYRRHPALMKAVAKSRQSLPGLWGGAYRLAGFDPYPDYLSNESEGWRLMEAILDRLVSQLDGRPLMIVPIPEFRYHFYGIPAAYQVLFDSFASRRDGVSVADITSPIRDLTREDRQNLYLKTDPHFGPQGHKKVAELISTAVRQSGVLGKETKAPTAKRKSAPLPKSKGKYVLGLSCFYHNSAAALVHNGKIVAAAEEERFTREKNDQRFPRRAVNFCLEQAGIHQDEIDAVVYYDNSALTFERICHTLLACGEESENAWIRSMPTWARTKLNIPKVIRENMKYEGLVLQNLHHRSHAASAFLASPYEEAAILTVDGVGEWSTASIGKGNGSKIELLKELRFPHSLGLLYSAFTQFTGFKVNSGEYKMMGLAPYGAPKYVDAILEYLVDLGEDGSIRLKMENFAFLTEPQMVNENFNSIFGGPPRKPGDRITRREVDIARSVQFVTEEAVLRMARHAHELTGLRKLCLSGGVALNCVANGRLLREGPFDEIWIQPAAGDSGSALGAALDVYHNYFDEPRVIPKDGRSQQGGSYWGPSFSPAEIESFLDTFGCQYHFLSGGERAKRVAKELAAGKVVGHFDGRLEFGPRALGNRSILADPRDPESQVKLNLKIKYRESFRPFAPTVLAEKVGEYFEIDCESPHMLLVAPVSSSRRMPFELDRSCEDLMEQVRLPRSDVPAITHVDYSARVQTVRREDNESYYDIIREFEKLTGFGVVVNTSFNVRGEPIVCSPYDAFRCFMRTEMDALMLGPYLLLKEEQGEWPEPKGHIEEEENVVTSTSDDVDDEFSRDLREVFHRDFLKVAALIPSKDIEVKRDGSGSTAWTDMDSNSNSREVFVFPDGLTEDDPDPKRLAQAVCLQWRPGSVATSLEYIVQKLIELGQLHEAREAAQDEASVSDSMYVMY
ncbi:MAG: carbamoyltransferase N-terminal domain-containing protein [Planctomycetota bacterium]